MNHILKIVVLIPFFLSNFALSALPDTLAIDKLFIKALEIQEFDSDSSLILARRGFLLSNKIYYKRGIGRAFMRIGVIYKNKGENDSALQYLRKAFSIRKKYNYYGELGNTLTEMSSVFHEIDLKDSAFYYLYEAQRIYEKLQDTLKLAESYNLLANLFLDYGNKGEALASAKKSNMLLINCDNLESISWSNKINGIVYYEFGNYQMALNYFKKAKRIDDSLNYESELARDLNYIGLCYEQLDDLKLSMIHFKEALTHCSDDEFSYYKAEILYNIGFHWSKNKTYDSAIAYFERAGKITTVLKLSKLQLKVLDALSESYALKGSYLKAYDYHVKYSDLNDSLINTEKVRSIADMQTKYETEKKEQQIMLLSEQNKTKTAQRNALIAGSIVLLLLFVASGIYFIQRNRIAKKNEQIAREEMSGILKEQEIKTYNAMIEGQEEERKRIATDLHDRLGSMLSTVKLLFSALDEKIDKNQTENQTQYSKATGLLDEAVLEVRRISHNLSTGMVSTFGLVAALEELCESIDNSKLIKCKLLCFGMNERLDQQTEIGLFRIVQELVNNALKHAKAKQLTIQLNRTEDSLNLTVEDDGIGFDMEQKKAGEGMGLKNLEARAAKLKGVYQVDSKPGRGTISIVEIPLI